MRASIGLFAVVTALIFDENAQMLDNSLNEFGAAGTLLALLSAIPYGLGIYRRAIRPHAFTWLIWSLVTIIAALGQGVAGAGPSAWCTAAIAVTCVLTFIASLWRGEPSRTRSDWACLVSALAAIPLWIVLKDPTPAVCLVTAIEICGFIPTIRKSWADPWGESLTYFGLCVLKYLCALGALQNWTLAAAIYPTVTCAAASALCGFIVYRRSIIPRPLIAPLPRCS